MNKDFVFEIYKDNRTVFTFQEIAMLVNEPDFVRLKQRINYYVNTGKLLNLRRGIYVKENYSSEELACKIFTPAYISLDYVLQKAGMIFQYSKNITIISYLRRIIHIDGHDMNYHKIKDIILYNDSGIKNYDNGISQATPERAFLDTLYLNKEFHFDSIHSLSREIVASLLSIYQSKKLDERVKYLFKNA